MKRINPYPLKHYGPTKGTIIFTTLTGAFMIINAVTLFSKNDDDFKDCYFSYIGTLISSLATIYSIIKTQWHEYGDPKKPNNEIEMQGSIDIAPPSFDTTKIELGLHIPLLDEYNLLT